MNNPHYNDNYYPNNINPLVYIQDEYQSYDSCLIAHTNLYLRTSMIATFHWHFFDEQLIIAILSDSQLSRRLTKRACVIDRYIPNRLYEFPDDYGIKIFNTFKKYSASGLWNYNLISNFQQKEIWINETIYEPLFSDVDYKIFNAYSLEFEIPADQEETGFTLTFYVQEIDANSAITLTKVHKTFKCHKTTRIEKLEYDGAIQICSIIINCNNPAIKQQIEANFDNISYLILYKNLDKILTKISLYLDERWFSETFSVLTQWQWKTTFKTFSYSEQNFESVFSTIPNSEIYVELPSYVKDQLQIYYYMYATNNPWGDITENENIAHNINYCDDSYYYQESFVNGNYTYELKKDDINPGFGNNDLLNYKCIDRNNQLKNNLFRDLDYYRLQTKENTTPSILNLLNNASPDDYWEYTSVLNFFMDQVLDPSGNSQIYGSITWNNCGLQYQNINNNNWWYLRIFNIIPNNTLLVCCKKLRYQLSGFSILHRYHTFKIWQCNKTIDDNGIITDNFTLLATGDFDSETELYNYEFNQQTITSTRTLSSGIKPFLFGMNAIADNTVIDYIQNTYHFTDEFLTTGENTMPDSIRIKELHEWQQQIIWALEADKFAYIDPENPSERRTANIGYYIERIARVLGISVNPDGSIRSIRQSKWIEQGGTLPAGWPIGQWGRNQGNHPTGQPGGDAEEDRDGLAYDVRTNKFTFDKFSGEATSIEHGGYVLVENIPQLLHIIMNDLDKALGMGDSGASVMPSINGEITTIESSYAMLAEIVYALSSLSRNIIGSHISSLKNQGMLLELIASQGTPIEYKNIQIDIGLDKPAKITYPGIKGASNFDQTIWIMNQLALILGSLLKIKIDESEEN